MSLSWRARRRWALALLLVGLPFYVVAAVSLLALFERPSIWLEFLVYVGLGLLWALPFKAIFTGIGRDDPEAPAPRDDVGKG
jgi:hypothetical protein